MAANVDLMKILSTNAATFRFSAGQVIVNEGDRGDEMFLVLSGKVGAYKNYHAANRVTVAELGPGEFFGEISMFMNKLRSTTVVAQDNVIIMSVNRGDVMTFLETQPQVALSLIQSLCRRLDAANSRGTGAPAPALAGAAPAAAKPTAPAAPAAKPAPAAPSSAPLASTTGLFPEGHKSYTLDIPAAPDDLVYEKKYECPLCTENFKAMTARETKLKVLSSGKDFRKTYEGIDMTHYEIITCPKCLFSTFDASMKGAIASRFYSNQSKITAFKPDAKFTFAKERNINEIFAGYYMALKCSPLCYANNHLNDAKSWLRLRWMYQDVKDTEMEAMATQKAFDAYNAVFENVDLPPSAAQQICIIVGELSLRIGDIASAKTFYTKARMHREGGAVMLKMAEDGIEEIKKVEAGEA
ncbi:MAG: DUF2225 domain-containing protein [Defluviitaleaceae bacterium]|nr:DUF2225 domain-containing protein [Defluviitaleaceae bacterium]MCL2275427.1 DUF2225 domain-containing protein [Defluviitaleaceae bacterium]